MILKIDIPLEIKLNTVFLKYFHRIHKKIDKNAGMVVNFSDFIFSFTTDIKFSFTDFFMLLKISEILKPLLFNNFINLLYNYKYHFQE